MPASPNTCEDPTSSQDVYHKMKQELDQKLANLHTKLSNIVLDEMDRQLDKIKLFDGNQQAATESPKTDSSRQTEKAINHTQRENISPIMQTTEHWLFQTQLHLLGGLNEHINYIGKGVDMNDPLLPICTNRNLYLRDFINECGLKYDNKAKTFVNSIGQESSEIDYFMHNLADLDFQAKQVLNELIENTSDHHPIRMSIKFKYKSAEVNRKQNNSMIKKKVNLEKVDKEWYSAHIDTHIDSLQINEKMEETAVEEAILKLWELLRETADLNSSSKAKDKRCENIS
ncbi:unnamed protein product [Mytilus coruscus]|uniref:Endonuclease/exonuclease/phosphatase domain-containing protein n=1 Tax=Mytilus coruscus TaxID=42192 RepID=A0A6J8E022_MYTCO|nr:unnamed protein product [Mytilus coruscus]